MLAIPRQGVATVAFHSRFHFRRVAVCRACRRARLRCPGPARGLLLRRASGLSLLRPGACPPDGLGASESCRQSRVPVGHLHFSCGRRSGAHDSCRRFPGKGSRLSRFTAAFISDGRLCAARVGVQDSDAPGPLGASCFGASRAFPFFGPARALLPGSGHQSLAGNLARQPGISIPFSTPAACACLLPRASGIGRLLPVRPLGSPGEPPPPAPLESGGWRPGGPSVSPAPGKLFLPLHNHQFEVRWW